MSLATVLADRRAATSCKDPDTLHGILFSLETEEQRAANAPTIIGMLPNLKLIDRARAGEVGRVPAFVGDDGKLGRAAREFPDGLFPLRWKREVIAALLSADGIDTSALANLLIECGIVNISTAEAMYALRQELKPFSVETHSELIDRGQSRYRIIGRSAWRMQKIIANGWSV